jgi:hypothetical protein
LLIVGEVASRAAQTAQQLQTRLTTGVGKT